jgi:signal transduction histidine kinase
VKFPLHDAQGAPFGIGGVTTDVTEWKKADDARAAAFDQLRALSNRIQQVREEERTRIAREIHDELGQTLTVLKLDLARLAQRVTDPESARDLDRMLGHVDGTIATVRRIATELRPSILDDFGLRAALEWLAEEFQARTRIPCTFESNSPRVRRRRELDTALFRIAQESLTNVARHARASAVRLELEESETACVLRVEDDGIGIPESAAAGRSLGLAGMRERAAELGGQLAFERLSPSGTRVTASVPLRD